MLHLKLVQIFFFFFFWSTFAHHENEDYLFLFLFFKYLYLNKLLTICHSIFCFCIFPISNTFFGIVSKKENAFFGIVSGGAIQIELSHFHMGQ